MGDILQFKKKKPADKHKGKTLCKHGFHKWEIQQEQKFDSQKGKLITLYKCARCGKNKNEAI